MDYLSEHNDLLLKLQAIIDGVGLHTEMFSYPEDSEMPTLVFSMPDDYKKRNRLATLTFLPVEEFDELKHSRLLQIMTELPFKASESAKPELTKFIVLVNNYLLAGKFSLANDMLFYRYSYYLPKDYDLANISVFETIIFSLSFIDSYAEAIEKVSDGILNAAEAMDFLNKINEV